jgi:hypothetical protein
MWISRRSAISSPVLSTCRAQKRFYTPSAKSCLLEPAEIDPKQSSLTIELTSGQPFGQVRRHDGSARKEVLAFDFPGIDEDEVWKDFSSDVPNKSQDNDTYS